MAKRTYTRFYYLTVVRFINLPIIHVFVSRTSVANNIVDLVAAYDDVKDKEILEMAETKIVGSIKELGNRLLYLEDLTTPNINKKEYQIHIPVDIIDEYFE